MAEMVVTPETTLVVVVDQVLEQQLMVLMLQE
jgi:hypothetical protein